MPDFTIDDVVGRFNSIIDEARRTNDRRGYFAALYRCVTLAVRDGIHNNRFQDGRRMERLVCAFAQRYFDAFDEDNRKAQPSRCWASAFDATRNWHVLILQHLLLGINAHINLDLGIAAAQVCPAMDELQDLSDDFDKINDILASLFKRVKDEMNTVSPLIGWLDRVAGKTDDVLINFSMGNARAAAWHSAEKLIRMEGDRRDTEIQQMDRFANLMATVIARPGAAFALVAFVVRLFEKRNVANVIDVLIEKK